MLWELTLQLMPTLRICLSGTCQLRSIKNWHAVLNLSAVLGVVKAVAVDEAFVEAVAMGVDSLAVEVVFALVMVPDIVMNIWNVESPAIQQLSVDQTLCIVAWMQALLLW